MNRPTFPIIIISDNKWIDLIPEENNLFKVATSALTDPRIFEDTIAFDSNGNKWTYKQTTDKFKNTLLTRILAKTFYNPLLDATVLWTSHGTYKIEELKIKFKKCVDEDDDIITQFEEGSVIKTEIDNSQTFDDLIKILNKYIFDVNEEEIWKEQEKRNK
jgi:hypothetical protein